MLTTAIGFITIMNEIKVGKLLMAKQENNTEEVKNIIKTAKDNGVEIVYIKEKDKIDLDNNTYLEILNIGKDTKNLNNNSIIVKLKYKTVSMLFTGDCEKEQEKEVLDKKINIRADILKVAHHGSSTSSSEEFLAKINPKIALIGVGKNNKFGHPNPDIIDKLKSNNIEIYRTDKMGEIIIEVKNNGKLNIETHIK